MFRSKILHACLGLSLLAAHASAMAGREEAAKASRQASQDSLSDFETEDEMYNEARSAIPKRERTPPRREGRDSSSDQAVAIRGSDGARVPASSQALARRAEVADTRAPLVGWMGSADRLEQHRLITQPRTGNGSSTGALKTNLSILLKPQVFAKDPSEAQLEGAIANASVFLTDLKQQEESLKTAEDILKSVQSSVTWQITNRAYYSAYYEEIFNKMPRDPLVAQCLLALAAKDFYKYAVKQPIKGNAPGTLFQFKTSWVPGMGWSPVGSHIQRQLEGQLRIQGNQDPSWDQIFAYHYRGSRMSNAWVQLNGQINQIFHHNAALMSGYLSSAGGANEKLANMCADVEKFLDTCADDGSWDQSALDNLEYARNGLNNTFGQFFEHMAQGLGALDARTHPASMAGIMGTMTSFLESRELQGQIQNLMDNPIGDPWKWRASIHALRTQMDVLMMYLASYQQAIMREHFATHSLKRQFDYYAQTLNPEFAAAHGRLNEREPAHNAGLGRLGDRREDQHRAHLARGRQGVPVDEQDDDEE